MKNQLEQHSQRKWTAADIGGIYGITGENMRQTVRTTKQSLIQPDYPPGRALQMTPEQETEICDPILEHDRERRWLTEGSILKWIEETVHCPRSSAWLARFLGRHTDKVVRTTVTPQEDPRLQVPKAWLDHDVALIAKLVPLACCELIDNMDGSGPSDLEDRRPKKVLASAESFGEKLHYGLNRGARHQTLVCTISAGGNVYCPHLLSPDRATREVFRIGIQENTDFWIWVKKSPCAD
jgi:hypothetical protein